MAATSKIKRFLLGSPILTLAGGAAGVYLGHGRERGLVGAISGGALGALAGATLGAVAMSKDSHQRSVSEMRRQLHAYRRRLRG
jgi:uncharacterized protein YcfJ